MATAGPDVVGELAALLSAVRSRRPLIHHMANFVTMQAVANVTRAIGALPIMAMAHDDAAETADQADALVLSLGTPTQDRLDAMVGAGRRAAARGIPIIFDPVGVGATSFRNAAARRLLSELPMAVVRANRGEAAALMGRSGLVRGVESVESVEAVDGLDAGALAPALARELARLHHCVAAITGPEDYVVDAERILIVENGHPWLQAVSGTGCMATAVVGAFCAVGADHLTAAAAALACFGLAAELAAKDARGPGTLIPSLLDVLYLVTSEQARHAARVRAA
ncbi:MAG: hydroxyethylthiazole kinase [Armatimonadota bacterium]